MDNRSIPPVRRGAEPFLLIGGDVGCVCTHGFTASPEEMRWLGEYLHARSLTIYAPRLSGHGTTPARMRQQHWMDWYDDVRDGVTLLRARCRKVFAAGLSMGGLLSLRVAAAGLVDGAIVMASPLYVRRRAIRYARWLKHVRRYVRARPGTLDAYVRDVQRQMGRDDYGRVSYDDWTSVSSVAQLYALMGDVRRHLPDITVPLLLIYSKNDQDVPFDNLSRIAGAVRSPDLVQQVLEHSDHVLTQDIERETVFAMVWDFIAPRMA
jgi:carboxylesterase